MNQRCACSLPALLHHAAASRHTTFTAVELMTLFVIVTRVFADHRLSGLSVRPAPHVARPTPAACDSTTKTNKLAPRPIVQVRLLIADVPAQLRPVASALLQALVKRLAVSRLKARPLDEKQKALRAAATRFPVVATGQKAVIPDWVQALVTVRRLAVSWFWTLCTNGCSTYLCSPLSLARPSACRCCSSHSNSTLAY